MKKTPILITLLIFILAAGGLYYFKFHHMSSHVGHTHEVEGKYICPMHPEVIQDKPGQCPICGMNLVLQKSSLEKSESVEGRVLTGLSLNQQQLIAVKTEPVQVRSLSKSISAFGRVAYDPDLYNAQEEYLSALKIEESSAMNPIDQTNKRGQKLLESARFRLQLLGLSGTQIKELEKTRRVDPRLLLAPAESDKAWIYADIYESDLSLVKSGQKAEVTSSAFPGEIFWGQVIAIDPVLNPKTRTVRARIEVGDPRSQFKPEVFVNVLIHAEMGKMLSIPVSAVMDSGNFKLVFVDQGEGNFEPRKIEIGKKADGYIAVKAGLKAGEKVVSNGNFLLDAESQLRGAAEGMSFYKGKEAIE